MRLLVLLSTYNGERYLHEQLDSIFNQEYIDVFLLIRDDGSDDSTLDILMNYKKIYGHQIEFIKGDNWGFSRSFHELTKIAMMHYIDKFDYFAFSDQDDIWLSNKLFMAVQFIYMNNPIPSIPLLYCSNLDVVDEKLHKLKKMRITIPITKSSFFCYNIATGCTCVFNAATLKYFVDSFDQKLIFHDYWMYLIVLYKGRILYDNNSYILYRQHDSNVTGKKNDYFYHRWKKYLLSLKEKPKNIESNMAKKLLCCYRRDLSKDDIRYIKRIALYRHDILIKLHLLCDQKIYPPWISLESIIILKLRILCNKL